MADSPCYVIAEAGVNHDGDVVIAERLIDAARNAGADAIKFQTFRTSDNVSPHAGLADYQRLAGVTASSQLEMLSRLELDKGEFVRLKRYADNCGIEFLSTPDDEWSLELLVELSVPVIKVASAEIDNHPFLRKVGKTRKRVMLSTGMSDVEEIRAALAVLDESGAAEVSLLHCTSCYPCPPEEANLLALQTLKSEFARRVGYSDHTVGTEAGVVARSLGAEILEKHLTLDRSSPGPDHSASANPVEFARYVAAVRLTEVLLGERVKQPTPCEEPNKDALRRSLVAARAINSGDVIAEGDLTQKRPGGGISPAAMQHVIGRRAMRAINQDEMIRWSDLEWVHEYSFPPAPSRS